MVYLLFFLGLVVLKAVWEVGIIGTLCYLAVTSLLVYFLTKIQTSANEEGASKTRKAFVKVFSLFIRIISVVCVIFGIISFIIGFTTVDSSITFKGELCDTCGGTRQLLGKECPSCLGSGYEFGRKYSYMNGTWSGVLLAASAGLVYFCTYSKSTTAKDKKEATVVNNKDSNTWICQKCKTENNLHVKTCQGCGTSKQWLDSHYQYQNTQSDVPQVDTVCNTEENASNTPKQHEGNDVTAPKQNVVRIGQVIEGRYAGAIVYILLEKKILFINAENGEKIALSKRNTISIDDVSEQYSSKGAKVIMVMWNDTEISVIQFGSVKM